MSRLDAFSDDEVRVMALGVAETCAAARRGDMPPRAMIIVLDDVEPFMREVSARLGLVPLPFDVLREYLRLAASG